MRVRLPLVHRPLGTWPAPQGCALPGSGTGDPRSGPQAGTRPTEPRQPAPGAVHVSLLPLLPELLALQPRNPCLTQRFALWLSESSAAPTPLRSAALGAALCVCLGEGVRLHFFTCGCLTAPASLVEQTISSPADMSRHCSAPFPSSFSRERSFSVVPTRHRFTTVTRTLPQVTPCPSARSPAGLATRARGPAKASTQARSTWCRPTITRYAGPSARLGVGGHAVCVPACL